MIVTHIIRHGCTCHTALQVLLFTATMPEALQEAAARWQRKPISIHLAPGEMSISQTITQVHSRIAVVSLCVCPDLSFNTYMTSMWVVFTITCGHAPACALLPLYAATCHCVYCCLVQLKPCCIYALHHSVYHCMDDCQSLSSFDALAC